MKASGAAELASRCGDREVPVAPGRVGPFRMGQQALELCGRGLRPIQTPSHVRVHRLVCRPLDEGRPVAGKEIAQNQEIVPQLEPVARSLGHLAILARRLGRRAAASGWSALPVARRPRVEARRRRYRAAHVPFLGTLICAPRLSNLSLGPTRLAGIHCLLSVEIDYSVVGPGPGVQSNDTYLRR
jgi:hypothetical protein